MIAVLADESQLPRSARVWGRENRVLPARERTALCWLTLARLLGWEVDVRYPGETGGLGPEIRCAIVARDLRTLSDTETAALRARLEREPMLVITHSPATDGLPATEGALRWVGPGPERRWKAWPTVAIDPSPAEGSSVWATLGDTPLVVARPVGAGFVATLAAHPVELVDAAPSGSGLLKRLLTRGIPGEPASLDLEGVVVPRMDDPGSSSSAHLDGWAHRSLGEGEWGELARGLGERGARVTVGYVPGWVDDGDAGRGELRVGGQVVERVPGRVHPSPLVAYESATAPQDNPAGARGIEALREAGAGEVELHGHTHIRPAYGRDGGPYAAWAAAEDAHADAAWYRELEDLAEAPAGEPGPVNAGLGLIREHLGADPVALCCPGHACSPVASDAAARAGLELVAAESVAIRHGERLAWCDHIRNPYVDGAEGPWLESGLPVIACLHDRDLVLHGTGWLGERLDEWTAAGARRITDLRDLAASLRVREGV